MDGSIIVHRKSRALVSGEFGFYALFILVPIVVLQRSDIEKSVRAAGIELRDVVSIECRPPVPNFLKVSLVWCGRGCGFLRPRFRKTKRSERCQTYKGCENSFHS